jgi:transcriptional pleiotropic regulator of transition state genes
MDINEKDAIEIYVDDNNIILKKYHPSCIFCGNDEEITDYMGKKVCKNCIENIKAK